MIQRVPSHNSDDLQSVIGAEGESNFSQKRQYLLVVDCLIRERPLFKRVFLQNSQRQLMVDFKELFPMAFRSLHIYFISNPLLWIVLVLFGHRPLKWFELGLNSVTGVCFQFLFEDHPPCNSGFVCLWDGWTFGGDFKSLRGVLDSVLQELVFAIEQRPTHVDALPDFSQQLAVCVLFPLLLGVLLGELRAHLIDLVKQALDAFILKIEVALQDWH